MEKINTLIQTPLIILIKLYQVLISPILGQRCRFYPSCSTYAKQAIQQHGVLKGIFLTIKRLVRCHPLCEGGVDMVPKKEYKP